MQHQVPELKVPGRGEIGAGIQSQLLGCDPASQTVLTTAPPSARLTPITDKGGRWQISAGSLFLQ